MLSMKALEPVRLELAEKEVQQLVFVFSFSFSSLRGCWWMEGCPAADGYLSFPPECVGGVAQNAETKVLRRHTFRLSSSFLFFFLILYIPFPFCRFPKKTNRRPTATAPKDSQILWLHSVGNLAYYHTELNAFDCVFASAKLLCVFLFLLFFGGFISRSVRA